MPAALACLYPKSPLHHGEAPPRSSQMTAIRVLIADDHAILREGLATLLQNQPDIRVVASAANGREAVRLAREFSPDVAILDIGMPEINGVEATRQILDRLPEIGVVILSMHTSAEIVFRALEAGARGYMDKDSVGAEMIAAIRAVHAGRRYLSARIAESMAEAVTRGRHDSPLAQLSRREREILQFVVEGHSSADIGRLLNLSAKTVDTYRSRLMQKLQLRDIASLVKFAIQHGITPLE